MLFTVIEPAKAFSNAFYYFQRGKAAIERFNEILDAPAIIDETENPTPLLVPTGSNFNDSIEYKDVSFQYRDNDKVVLNKINLGYYKILN